MLGSGFIEMSNRREEAGTGYLHHQPQLQPLR